MATTFGSPGASDETEGLLRNQIEAALRAEGVRRREARRRVTLLGLACAALAASLVLNLLVVTAPGLLGLTSRTAIDRVEREVAGLREARTSDIAQTADLIQRVGRVERNVTGTLPAICATLGGLGAWAYQSGTPPPNPCAPPAAARTAAAGP